MPADHHLCFYTGENALISRAITLLSTPVSILREIGLFRLERAMPKFQAGAFPSCTMIQVEQRKRLAISLFKIALIFPYLDLNHSSYAQKKCTSHYRRRIFSGFRVPPKASTSTSQQNLLSDRLYFYFDLRERRSTSHRTSLATIGPSAIEEMLLFPEDIQFGLCS